MFVTVMTLALAVTVGPANEAPQNVWPKLAPGETNQRVGTVQPFRANEQPRVTRVTNITQPTYTIHRPATPNGSAVVILPGGGFAKVVPDKEGTEAADWLNKLGVTAFVLSYRTRNKPADPGWRKPLQDAQRLLSTIRSRSGELKLNRNHIGLLGFSAGGQVAARLLCAKKRAYAPLDSIDDVPFRPDFAILIYPWNIYDTKNDDLISGVVVPQDCPPTFLAHTHDDRSSSLGAVLFYAALKRHGIASELHVYGNGGHGYGLRPVRGSQISSWPDHAGHWLQRQIPVKPRGHL